MDTLLRRIAELEELVEALRRQLAEQDRRIEELVAENARLRLENKQLQQRVAELEGISARQAAPFRRDDADKRPLANHKRPGRPVGHPGAYRRRPRYLDDQIEVPLSACPQCGGRLEDRSPLVQYIEELPPLRPRVTRLTTWTARCPQCGEVHSSHPLQTSRAQGAASTLLGPRAQALAVLLNKRLGLPLSKTSQVLKKLMGLSITPGGLAQLNARVAAKTAEDYERLIAEIRGSAAVFADETSWWVRGLRWLWTFTTPQATLYRIERQRSSDIVRDTLGDNFQGMLVSDCLVVYDKLNCRKHKCIAHHLRAIHHARERPDTKDPSYLDRWKGFFQTVILWHGLRSRLSAEQFAEGRQGLEHRCDELLAEVRTQSGDLAVQNRLRKQRAHLLGCLTEQAAEPTNNRAERALRPAVLTRKISCGNRTDAGAATWETLVSLAVTCEQQARDFVDYLTARLQMTTPAR
jgi:hypothetical protein